MRQWVASVARRLGGGKKAGPSPAAGHRGMLVFSHTGEVIKAQRALEKEGLPVKVKGPPPHLRTGCDMVVEFSLVEEPAVRRALAMEGLEPMQVLPVEDRLLEPVSLYRVTDYGEWLMVRAANMKITVEKNSRRIVNISGGGCPDVPYLAALLSGKTLDEATLPKDRAQTLCGYALQLAFEEMVRQCPG